MRGSFLTSSVTRHGQGCRIKISQRKKGGEGKGEGLMGMLKVCFSVTQSMNIYIQRIYDTSLSIKIRMKYAMSTEQ